MLFDAQWLEEWLALQNVPQVSKAVSPALPLLQAGAAAFRAGARSRIGRSAEVARGKSIFARPRLEAGSRPLLTLGWHFGPPHICHTTITSR